MKLIKKFEINTDDFKIYFDNNKKAHICENIETGEKTNLRCLGILMQMGILKPLEFSNGSNISPLIKKLEELEKKISKSLKKEPEKEKNNKQPKKKEPKKEIKEHIMDNALEKADENLEQESEEEINNWEEI